MGESGKSLEIADLLKGFRGEWEKYLLRSKVALRLSSFSDLRSAFRAVLCRGNPLLEFFYLIAYEKYQMMGEFVSQSAYLGDFQIYSSR